MRALEAAVAVKFEGVVGGVVSGGGEAGELRLLQPVESVDKRSPSRAKNKRRWRSKCREALGLTRKNKDEAGLECRKKRLPIVDMLRNSVSKKKNLKIKYS
jgi:hypothetical protein